jgi:glutamate racemase
VIEPGAQAAVSVTQKNKVLLLATETTVHSGIYQAAIRSFNPKIEVYAQSCGLLVPFAEEGLVEEEITNSILKKYLEPMIQQADWPDCVILGCTHFPVFKKMMAALLGQAVHIVDSAKETAQAVFQTLQTLGLQRSKGPTSIQFLVTDLPERFHRIGKIFFGQALDPEKIQLIDATSSEQKD